MKKVQDKHQESAFFDALARSGEEYDVFTERSTERLLDACLRLGGFERGARIADLGCGSGAFTARLAARGFSVVGVDLSRGLLARARRRSATLELVEADVEKLAFSDDNFDGVLLSGIVHHLPDPSACAAEVRRILKPGATFVAFDPNRLNPFMYLYRDRSSPFYSSRGVTPNERPVLAREVRHVFEAAGFEVTLDYLSGLHYRYVDSPAARALLPAYNLADSALSWIRPLRGFSAFLLTRGRKASAA